jgi:hypothetical protein
LRSSRQKAVVRYQLSVASYQLSMSPLITDN